MIQVKNDPSVQRTQKITILGDVPTANGQDADSLPPAGDGLGFNNISIQLPSLAKPIDGLSLDNIVMALGYEASRQACKQGLTRLEGKNQQQKEVNEKQLDTLKERLKILEKNEHMSTARKIFDIVGLVVALAALAVLTGGSALMIAGAVIGVACATFAVAGDFTHGKGSISGLIAMWAEHDGKSKAEAQKIGMIVEISVAVLGAALSIGGGFQVKSLIDSGEKTIAGLRTTTAMYVSDTASGVMTSGEAVLSGVSADLAKDASVNEARQKELSAILENIQASRDTESDLLAIMVESSSKLMEALMGIVNDYNASQQAALTAKPKLA